MCDTDDFIDDLECEIAGLRDDVTDLRAKLEATETTGGGAEERVYALLNAEGLLPYMARISNFTPEEVEAGMLADADAQAERDNHAFVQRIIRAADQPEPANAGYNNEARAAAMAEVARTGADIPELLAVRGERHCDNPLCTRIGARCVGWHCPRCGEATSSQGHDCEAHRA